MTKPYVLFDLDGTLTDPAEGITNSIPYALREMGADTPAALLELILSRIL